MLDKRCTTKPHPQPPHELFVLPCHHHIDVALRLHQTWVASFPGFSEAKVARALAGEAGATLKAYTVESRYRIARRALV